VTINSNNFTFIISGYFTLFLKNGKFKNANFRGKNRIIDLGISVCLRFCLVFQLSLKAEWLATIHRHVRWSLGRFPDLHLFIRQ